uniref:Uncharacterized protein n=1 Tax=Rhizophora mucronata TaxID=61149 RepID=A0A2P2Q3M5_RHIMU
MISYVEKRKILQFIPLATFCLLL